MAASEKQVAFAERLMDRIVEAKGAETAFCLQEVLIPGGGVWEDLPELEGHQVGKIIDILLAITKLQELDEQKASVSNPDADASDKQKDYIKSLAEKAGEEVDVEGLTKGKASEMIESLNKKVKG